MPERWDVESPGQIVYLPSKQKYRATRATEACNLLVFSRLLRAGCIKRCYYGATDGATEGDFRGCTTCFKPFSGRFL
jgi:hypothetical protein